MEIVNIWLVYILWFITIFIATSFISQYIKMRNSPDVAIAFYIFYLTLSQVLAAKIGDFGMIGSFSINAPAAVLIFPFTFQITDIVNEYFGQKETHRMILIAFVSQILMTIFIWFSIQIDPAYSWITPSIGGNEFSNDYWNIFFGTTIRITIASWISFMITENFDAVIYAKVKKWTNGKALWVRNVISDVPTLALDSLIFVSLAFIGVLPEDIILTIIIGQILTKWFFGLIDTPFIYLSRGIVDGKINIFGNLFKSQDIVERNEDIVKE
ncbi:MAG: queuosine precursor transporter [archaeon]|nr:queuosine precursor transporter [archaeon]